MAKKKADVLAKERDYFINGAPAKEAVYNEKGDLVAINCNATTTQIFHILCNFVLVGNSVVDYSRNKLNWMIKLSQTQDK